MRLMLSDVIKRIRAVADDTAGGEQVMADSASAMPVELLIGAETEALGVHLYGYVALTESAHLLYGILVKLKALARITGPLPLRSGPDDPLAYPVDPS
jgi:hypothetical protein